MKLDALVSHGVLCFGGEDWWYHNRGHCDMQYMRQFAQGAPVLYVNSIVMRKPNLKEGRVFWLRLRRKLKSMLRGLSKVKENFWVYSPLTAPLHHLRSGRWMNDLALRAQMKVAFHRTGLHAPLIWVNCPAACTTAIAQRRIALIYQRTDRYEEYPGVDPDQIRRYDRTLKENADLTFFSNARLFEEERRECRKAAFIDHGVDYDLFAGAEKDSWIPPEMEALRHPVVGFYGGIDTHTFDLELMAEVIEALPDLTFVLIGKATMDCSSLMGPNVQRIEQKPYEEIPHYGKCFDVCIMPWNRNRWIEACNPIKLKEYLALGKPVVSTPFPQLEGYGDLVLTGRTPSEFALRIREALGDRPGGEEERKAFARKFSWHGQAEKILSMLESAAG